MSRAPKNEGGLGAKAMDAEGRSMIFEGCSLSQLSQIFDMDNRVIARKIHGLPPCGQRMGYDIYALREAAAFLIPPATKDIEHAIKRMSARDLPPALTKEYWGGQHARLKFEEDAGDLWRTSDVIETLSAVFKTLRMSILLMRDQVERQDELSDRQRGIIQSLIDTTLNELSATLVKRFSDDKPRRNNSEPDWEDPNIEEEESL